MELKSEETMGKRKIEETEGEDCDMFCCLKCGFDPCKWVSVGKALLPEVHEFVEKTVEGHLFRMLKFDSFITVKLLLPFMGI